MSDAERNEGRDAGRDEGESAVQNELRREAAEGKGSIGDVSENRNLSGSSTWETLPESSRTDPSAERGEVL